MERAEIAELFYNALIDSNKSEQLLQTVPDAASQSEQERL